MLLLLLLLLLASLKLNKLMMSHGISSLDETNLTFLSVYDEYSQVEYSALLLL